MHRVFSLLAGFGALAPGVIPARTLAVNQRHPAANDSGAATEERPPRTIGHASAIAQPGDTVLHSRVYRERVIPARGFLPGKPISYEAAADETFVVKGSGVWKPQWREVKGRPNTALGLFVARMFGDYNPYRILLVQGGARRPATGPRFLRTPGQVFADDAPYSDQETLDDVEHFPAPWMTTPASPAGGGTYVHFTPSYNEPDQRFVAISVRERISCPEKGAVSTRSGNHWIIESNTVRYAKSTGSWVGSDGSEPMPQFQAIRQIPAATASLFGGCRPGAGRSDASLRRFR